MHEFLRRSSPLPPYLDSDHSTRIRLSLSPLNMFLTCQFCRCTIEPTPVRTATAASAPPLSLLRASSRSSHACGVRAGEGGDQSHATRVRRRNRIEVGMGAVKRKAEYGSRRRAESVAWKQRKTAMRECWKQKKTEKVNITKQISPHTRSRTRTRTHAQTHTCMLTDSGSGWYRGRIGPAYTWLGGTLSGACSKPGAVLCTISARR
jgi:hypothetical protein